MYRLQAISSLDLPELQPYLTMRRQMEHRQQGIFVAEGEKVVRRLLDSDLAVVSVLLPEKWFQALEPVLKARPETIDTFVAEKKVLEQMTGFSMYQGLLAVGKVPPAPDLDVLLESLERPLLLTALDSLSSGENIGAVVRNCAAFNAQVLIVSNTCASPFLRRAVRSSMGTIFQLPIVEEVDLPKILLKLRARGVSTIGAHTHAARSLDTSTSLEGDCCVVFGSEGYGISQAVLRVCDETLAVPMAPAVDSMNVASAAAVFLYEVNRKRGWTLPRTQEPIRTAT